MKGDQLLREAIDTDASLATIDVLRLAQDYDNLVEKFYGHFSSAGRKILSDDAIYHKRRYIDMARYSWGPQILEVGSDKPFVTFLTKRLNASSNVETLSIDIPESPYDITFIDIESERFPYEDNTFSTVIFTEVIEHLWRNPSWTVKEINRILQPNGRVYITTPNACGSDIIQNVLFQQNPNLRNQFFAMIESGHPHLWTPAEVELIHKAHGFETETLTTVAYYDINIVPEIQALIDQYSPNKTLHADSIKYIGRKARHVTDPVYPPELYPDGEPVQYRGSIRKWGDIVRDPG